MLSLIKQMYTSQIKIIGFWQNSLEILTAIGLIETIGTIISEGVGNVMLVINRLAEKLILVTKIIIRKHM